MGYRVGEIPDQFGAIDESHKFVIIKKKVKEGECEVDCYFYYADIRGSLGNLDYSGLVSRFNFKDVVCSGLVTPYVEGSRIIRILSGPVENRVVVDGSTQIIKGAPREFMKGFETELLREYKIKWPKFEKLENICNPDIKLELC